MCSTHAYVLRASIYDYVQGIYMSETMDIEKKETMVALAVVGCFMVLKICILVALFAGV